MSHPNMTMHSNKLKMKVFQRFSTSPNVGDPVLTAGCSSLYRLGVYKTPTFHFFLKGEKVDELAKPSISSLLKTLANVYNPSGMKKRIIQA
ncbi:hypothetical protein TB2_033113 [Malus domestica]